MEARLVVEAAARVALEVVVAGVIQRLETQKAHAAWHAFALGATVGSQAAVFVFEAGVSNVRLKRLKGSLGLADAESKAQR